MAYFDLFPDVLLPSFSNDRNSSSDLQLSKNLFKRGKIRDDFFENAVAFNKYAINGDDRPDNVAFEIYKREDYDWIVLLSNNIINIKDEWPMSQYDFQRYLENKYDTVQLTQIHHYETIRQFDLDDNVILEGGLVVDEDFTFNYTQDGTIENISGSELVKSVTNYEYEIDKNDKKREIVLLRKEYIGVIKEDMREIMTYQDSSQYINRKMKKGENLRILSSR